MCIIFQPHLNNAAAQPAQCYTVLHYYVSHLGGDVWGARRIKWGAQPTITYKLLLTPLCSSGISSDIFCHAYRPNTEFVYETRKLRDLYNVCVCVCACVRACVRACVCVCVCLRHNVDAGSQTAQHSYHTRLRCDSSV